MGKQQHSKDVIQYISVESITPSELNPRKTFDEESLNELAQNIHEQGILQPITVRNVPIIGLEIVCGERRYRAAKIAELEAVPCIVRELTDEEAFDIMITENLQRKDVEPLEEAAAFKQLIEKRGYDIENLCTRFGKSEKYIRIRLKLNDLIEPFKELMAKDIIKVGHASEIAKVSADQQEKLYAKEFSSMEASWWSCPSVSDIKRSLTSRFLHLDEAKFDTSECITCPKNTACNVLFSDVKGARCTDVFCYRKRCTDFIVAEATRVSTEEPGTVIVYDGQRMDSDAKCIIDQLEESGVELTDQNKYRTDYDAPDEPGEPEKPDREDYEDEEDYTEDMERYEEDLQYYQKEVEKYPAELEAYKNKLEQGTAFKAFHINGYNVGGYSYLKAREESNAAKITSTSTIDNLQAKDKRNAEIKHEKTVEDAKKLLADSEYLSKTDGLTDEEKFVFCMLALVNGTDKLRKKYNAEFYDLKPEKVFKTIRELGEGEVNVIFRSFIKHQLVESNQYEKYMHELLLCLAGDQLPEQLKEVEEKHQATYLKRKNSIEKRIEEAQKEAEAKA